MSGSFLGIHIASSALRAHQSALDVINHNVANANTPGYRRQSAQLVAGVPFPTPNLHSGWGPGQFGLGVQVGQIKRFSTDFFDGRYRRELADSARFDAQRQVLAQVEAVLGEKGSEALTNKIDSFFNGWQALSTDPSNTALRSDLRESAAALTAAFNSRALGLRATRADQDLALQQRVDEVNTTAGQLARLNAEIALVVGRDQQPNDLLDQRDRLADRLAELAGAEVSRQDDETVMVSIGGHALVVGTSTFRLATAPDPANDNLLRITWQTPSPSAFSTNRGELAGILDARDRIIKGQLDGLNQLAQSLISRVNTQHAAGFRLNSATPGGAFFDPTVDPSGNYALSIRLSADIVADVANIAAAGSANSPGDGNNAIALNDLRRALTMGAGTSTFTGFYTQQTGQLALETRSAEARYADRKAVALALDEQREAVGGVNLDEEAANLLQTQKAYQAAARLMTAVDEMLDRLINNTGLVGR
jgi:flagellar hook-associated protein 1 FlgK